MSVWRHSPKEEMVSDVGVVYLLLTAMVDPTDTGLIKYSDVCLDTTVYTLKLSNVVFQGSLSPTTHVVIESYANITISLKL